MCRDGAWPVLFLFHWMKVRFLSGGSGGLCPSLDRPRHIHCRLPLKFHSSPCFAVCLLLAICYCSLFVNCTMVFGVGLIINAVLVAIPVGGSVGALMGIDAHRAATGQKPLFAGGNTEDGSSPGGGNGGSGSTGDGGNHNSTSSVHGTQSTEYCDLSWGITPPSKTEQYTRE